MKSLVIGIEELELSVSFDQPIKTAVIGELFIEVLKGIKYGKTADEIASGAEISVDCVWQIIAEAEAVFGFPLVDRSMLNLTQKGQALFMAYESVKKKTAEYATQQFGEAFSNL